MRCWPAVVAITYAACGDSSARVDAGTPPVDTRVDAAIDAPIDAPTDAPIDAPVDAPVDAPPLPDLALGYTQMAASIYQSREAFSGDACVLDECLAQPGLRRLLRFDTMVINQGDAPLVLGQPDPDLAQWEFDACHQHYHYVDFADYQLLDGAGSVIAVGHKQSFCLRDDRMVGEGSTSPSYDCTMQGLSPGWADIYVSSLDCQFIDITGVAPGAYMLRIELNADRTITESSYDNDVALFPVTIQ